MGLPKLEKPKVGVVTPISNQKIKVSPFTMKEQKILAIIKNSKNQGDILAAMLDIVESCSTADVSKLDPIEFQWVFLQIRKVSAGRFIESRLICGSCQKPTEAKIDLDDFVVLAPEKMENKIELTDKIGLMLRKIDVTKLVDIDDSDDNEMLKLVIDYIYDENDIYKPEDFSADEIVDFMDNIPLDKLQKIVDWIQNRGSMILNKDWDCPHCKAKNNLKVEGIGDFFT
jgi:hypothetical protein